MSDAVTPPDAAIHLDDVSKVFGKADTEAYRAVDGLDLDVRPGQMLALLGKTGCGKSTIFNMIAGLTAPTSSATTTTREALPRLTFQAVKISGRIAGAIITRNSFARVGRKLNTISIRSRDMPRSAPST